MNPNPIGGDDSNLNPQYATGAFLADKSIKPASNDNRSTSYSEGTQSKIDPTSLDDRKTKIQNEAKEMRETASKRSKTIRAVGFIAGAIAVIVGCALALAGIATTIPFIIAGISIFAGIIFSIASLPETDQMYEARLTVKYVKEALTSNDKEKAEVLRYINKILETTESIGNEEFYLSEDRNNLLRLAVQTILVENKKEIYDCLINGNEDVKSSAIILLTKAKIENLSENEKRIQGLLNGEELTDVQSHDLLIIKTMLYSKDSNVSKTGINVLTNTINKSKDTAKKLFADGILNQGTVKKMIHNESTKDEMLDLLASMSKDEDLKDVVVDLVGSDIADKLTTLNPESITVEGNEIIEQIKGLKLGIPIKLNAGDIVYKDSHDFGKKLTILQQSEENIKKANELKEIFKNQENENELKNRFSKNDGLRYEDGKIQGCFLQDDKHDFNKETNKIDSKKVADASIRDINRDLFSIKRNDSKYIIKNQDKVGTELEKLLKNEPTKDESTKIIKNDMKVDINTLCSFPGQSVQGNITFFLLKNGLSSENILSTYGVLINDDGTIDLTIHQIHKVGDSKSPPNTFPVAIEEKLTFRLNKQKENEYVPITPLEAQVNVYDADVLVDDNKNAQYKGPLALRIREKITSIDWKNDKVENNEIKK